MNEPRRKQTQGRRREPAPPRRLELWRPVPQLPEPQPIARASDPTALLRSLGDPPLQGQGAVAEHYFAAVLEQAAGLARALAAAADLLADEESGQPKSS